MESEMLANSILTAWWTFADQMSVGSDNLINSFLADVSLDSPSCEDMALLEDLLNFLQSSLSRFGEAKEDVNARRKIEGGENEISLSNSVRLDLYSKPASTYLPCNS